MDVRVVDAITIVGTAMAFWLITSAVRNLVYLFIDIHNMMKLNEQTNALIDRLSGPGGRNNPDR